MIETRPREAMSQIKATTEGGHGCVSRTFLVRSWQDCGQLIHMLMMKVLDLYLNPNDHSEKASNDSTALWSILSLGICTTEQCVLRWRHSQRAEQKNGTRLQFPAHTHIEFPDLAQAGSVPR